jgi:hypothetical protein
MNAMDDDNLRALFVHFDAECAALRLVVGFLLSRNEALLTELEALKSGIEGETVYMDFTDAQRDLIMRRLEQLLGEARRYIDGIAGLKLPPGDQG